MGGGHELPRASHSQVTSVDIKCKNVYLCIISSKMIAKLIEHTPMNNTVEGISPENYVILNKECILQCLFI